MQVGDLMERFIQECPGTVMLRVTLGRLLSVDRLDGLFKRHASRQKCGELLFSTVAGLMGLVSLKIKPSVNAAFQHCQEEIGVSITSVYNKLQGIEPQVGRALVRETAEDLLELVQFFPNAFPKPVLPGYKTRIMDGNHLAGTEHRIEELRVLGAAALPGQCLAILDPDHRLMVDVIPCEDGHANESTLFPQVLELVEPGEVWIGDRQFGSQIMMTTIALDKQSHFVFRHSMAVVPKWETTGPCRKKGHVQDALLEEQAIKITYKGRALPLRRVTVKLDKPTRKGESEIHLLTNLPQRISAKQIAHAYRQRWKIEAAFGQLAQSLHSEIKTLGYPQAALFSFCVSLMMFNLLSVIKSAIASSQGSPEVADEVSTYYLALEIASSWGGFMTAVNRQEFETHYGKMSDKKTAQVLIAIAGQVNFKRIRKSHRGPKRPPPKRKSGNRGNHVATSRLLAKRKNMIA